jgi:hypothetical protein
VPRPTVVFERQIGVSASSTRYRLAVAFKGQGRAREPPVPRCQNLAYRSCTAGCRLELLAFRRLTGGNKLCFLPLVSVCPT